MFIYVAILIILMLFWKLARGRPTWTLRAAWCPRAPCWWPRSRECLDSDSTLATVYRSELERKNEFAEAWSWQPSCGRLMQPTLARIVLKNDLVVSARLVAAAESWHW